MSERLAVCNALAAMIRQHGEASAEEITFVGMAAMQLGLSDEENAEVQRTLKEGGDVKAALSGVTSKAMRSFLFRRILAAALLDEQISAQEQAVIDESAEALELDRSRVPELVAWMRVQIEVEKRLASLLAEV